MNIGLTFMIMCKEICPSFLSLFPFHLNVLSCGSLQAVSLRFSDIPTNHQHRHNLCSNLFTGCLFDHFKIRTSWLKRIKAFLFNPLGWLHYSGTDRVPNDVGVCFWRCINTYHGPTPGPLPIVFHLLHKVVAADVREEGEPVDVRAGLGEGHTKTPSSNT